MGHQIAHVVIERASEPDCRFIGSWFVKAAEAQGLWSQALRNPSFREWVFPLCEYFVPDLECAAVYVFGELEQQHQAIAVNVEGDLTVELAMMVHLGFFVRAGQSYRLAVPESVTLERVQQAALRVMSTTKDLGFGPVVEPELLLHTVPEAEAEAWREWIIQMRRLNSEAYGKVQVAGGIRLSLGNAGFRILINGSSKVGHKMQLARKDWVLFAGG
ncbi:hypothetical protein QA640_44165 (plasmid) [Bradyrhizobium sp. CB82]|uniref:hypothetical protein n=1 Tax=Bradyrhizobium sp. CB82 TaxID=3039159 RepID=UPI0024B10467|nr:hypothetical protein [Bradyrhizobium sp. CB82]WFU45827.1 hypothetical protein QA640_44165 [Bradyrhizobium sp. CB82]